MARLPEIPPASRPVGVGCISPRTHPPFCHRGMRLFMCHSQNSPHSHDELLTVVQSLGLIWFVKHARLLRLHALRFVLDDESDHVP